MAGRADADTVVVIGLGRFGEAVARKLAASGREVMVLDPDPELIIPNEDLSLDEGAIAPWSAATIKSHYEHVLTSLGEEHGFSMKTAWSDLTPAVRKLLLFGGVFFGLFKRFRGAFFSPPSRYTIKEGTEKTERKALKDVFADDERADGGGADETASFTVEPEMIEDPEISPAETDDATGKEEDLQEEDAVSADEELQRGQSDEESAGTAGKSTRQRRRTKRMKKENE